MCELAGIQEKVRNALLRLYREDAELMELDANERSVTHWLATYIQEEFPDWNVDCEYNRKGKLPKKLRDSKERVSVDDTNARTVYPDIIVHRREQPENLLVVESKKESSGESIRRDLEKLAGFGADSDYHYLCGLFVLLGRQRALLQWFTEGKPDGSPESFIPVLAEKPGGTAVGDRNEDILVEMLYDELRGLGFDV